MAKDHDKKKKKNFKEIPKKYCCPQLWEELHTRALLVGFLNPSDEKKFIKEWAEKIPSFGCPCKAFWNQWIKINPPNLTSKDKYFEWTVRAHNGVNVKLGRSVWSVDRAKEKWSH